MPTLLAPDVSPREYRSISRALGKRFVEHWQARNSGGTVIYRDLNASRIPYMDNDWIADVYLATSAVEIEARFRVLVAIVAQA